MTPFMAAVAAVFDVRSGVGAAETVKSLPKSVGEGADRQVMIRSMAEQMVCEANAVLAAHNERVELTDQPVDGLLKFTLRYRDRCAEVSTTFTDKVAKSRVWCEPEGGWHEIERAESERELPDPQAVADLILALIAGAPLIKRHPTEA
ncbi:hypothetical protein [Mycolicibacterium sp.]|uniref:hypothetical protein n=1 Tax=Mycolicibacterium sp. TaxID=2320850 RepID=UPI0037C7B033